MEERFAQHPVDGTARALVRVRSTLLLSGIRELRGRNLFDAYCENLDPSAREVVLGAIAGEWLPIAIAMAHFEACDALNLSSTEAFEIGQGSGKRIQQSVLHTLVRLAAGAGTTPWTVFENYGRLWRRILDGGQVVVLKCGPKEARIDCHGLPPARFAYFRNAFRGTNHVGLSLFARSLFIRELPQPAGDGSLSYRVSWV